MAGTSRNNQWVSSGGGEGVWDNLVLSWRLYRDPRVSNWLKRLPIVMALIYLVVPFDLIPDVFVGVGQLDDLGVMGLMALSLTWLPRFAPRDVVEEYRSDSRGQSAGYGDTQRSERAGTQDAAGNVIDPPFTVR